MKTGNIFMTALAILGLAMLMPPATQAQTCEGNGTNFVDLNGDGFNDNAPDHDDDGIPNGLDEDYIKNPQDGSGYQKGKPGEDAGSGMAQNKTKTKSQKFNRLQASNGNLHQNRVGAQGSMNGSGAGVCDGSGGGAAGTGVCDGTGPHGNKTCGRK